MFILHVPWAQFWPKPNACEECVPGTQLNYQVCLTATSLLLRQLFRDYPSQRTKCFWHHMLAAISRLNHAEKILSEVSAPTPCSIIYHKTLSEANIPSEKISLTPPFYKLTTDNYSFSDKDSQVTEKVRPSRHSWAFHQNEGATSVKPTVPAGTRQRGLFCAMSQRMAESAAQGLQTWLTSLP